MWKTNWEKVIRMRREAKAAHALVVEVQNVGNSIARLTLAGQAAPGTEPYNQMR